MQYSGIMGVWVFMPMLNRWVGKCVTHQRINKKGGKETDERGKTTGLRPFQSIHIDFTEKPRVG
jgi:hypothetical protein